jgi:hypothetical protein
MIKELVKQNKLSPRDGINRLWAKADTGMGGTGTKILKRSKTFKWLIRKDKSAKK